MSTPAPASPDCVVTRTPGHAPLQRGSEIGRAGLHQFVRTHGRHRSRQVLARNGAVTDDHHLVDRADLFLQGNVVMCFPGLDIDLGSLVADEPDLQRSRIHPFDRESPAGVGRSARLRPGNDDRRTDHRAAVLVDDPARNLRSILFRLRRRHGTRHRNEKPHCDEKQYVDKLFHKFPNISSFRLSSRMDHLSKRSITA